MIAAGMEYATDEFDRAVTHEIDATIIQRAREIRSCAHVAWRQGCASCAEWAVVNGVEFAREMASRDTTEGVIRQLAEEIRATGSKPSSLPIGASFSMVGSWRVYFNAHAAAPLVWNIAPGDGGWEVAVASLTIHAPATCVYEPKGTGSQPVAWLAVDGQLTVCIAGHASIGVPG